ncbi:MAG: TolC family protein [Candidatus Puniceispirillaceae bacterium]
MESPDLMHLPKHHISLVLVSGAIFAAFALLGTPAGALTLEQTLRSAVGNSLALQSARETWLSSREEIGTAVSTSEWRATGTVTGNQYKTDAASSAKNGFLDSQSLNATVSLSRNLYDGGQMDENTRLRVIQLDIAEARYFAAEQQVLMQAVETYLSVLKATRQVNLSRSNVARLEQHVTASRVRLDAGAATLTQLAQAEARLSRARTSLIDSLTALRNAEDSFLTLTGSAAESLDADIDAGALPSTLLEADDLARETHPDARVARLQVDAAMQQFNALMASVKPTVAFSLNATEAMAEGTRSDKTEFSAQIKLSSPLMPTESIRAKSRGLSASLQAAKFDRDDRLRQISLAVRTAFRNLETARSQRAAVIAELAASRLVAEGINNEFQFGQKTTLDVLDAEQDVSDAELREVDADHAILMAAFRLRGASGQLTAQSLGIDDVFGPLDDMQPVEPRFTSWVPLEVEWPEADEGQTDDKAAEATSKVADEAVSVTPVAELDEADLAAPASVAEIATMQIDLPGDEGATPVRSGANEPVIAGSGGVVWNIQTSLP